MGRIVACIQGFNDSSAQHLCYAPTRRFKQSLVYDSQRSEQQEGQIWIGVSTAHKPTVSRNDNI